MGSNITSGGLWIKMARLLMSFYRHSVSLPRMLPFKIYSILAGIWSGLNIIEILGSVRLLIGIGQ